MYKILVIDDEKPILDMVRQALTRFGFAVETASDGSEGIEKYDRHNFDLVITDIKMPGLDGIQVAAHIRHSCRPDTPVFGVSGTHWLLENGHFDQVFAKPFSLTELGKAIRSYLTLKPLPDFATEGGFAPESSYTPEARFAS